MASNGLVVYSCDYSQSSSLLPIKMTLISGIYCYVLVAIFLTNCETKSVSKDHKWITTGIRFDDNEAKTHLRLRRENSLGDVCTSDDDCNRHINNSECRVSKCECKTEFISYKNGDLSIVCNKINNSSEKDLRHENTPDNTSSSPSSPQSTHMLVIMIVLGLMFIGMCVALNLFSRARFRNHRSVFSNPRMIDMAKAQEGRASQSALRKGVQNSRGSSDFEVES